MKWLFILREDLLKQSNVDIGKMICFCIDSHWSALKRDIDFSFIYQNDSLIQNFIDNNEILGIHFLPLDEHMIKYISSKSIK